MKCDKCKACMVIEYSESYEQDFECLCGIKDNDRTERKDGLLGCNLHYQAINKAVERDSEMSNNEYLRYGY